MSTNDIRRVDKTPHPTQHKFPKFQHRRKVCQRFLFSKFSSCHIAETFSLSHQPNGFLFLCLLAVLHSFLFICLLMCFFFLIVCLCVVSLFVFLHFVCLLSCLFISSFVYLHTCLFTCSFVYLFLSLLFVCFVSLFVFCLFAWCLACLFVCLFLSFFFVSISIQGNRKKKTWIYFSFLVILRFMRSFSSYWHLKSEILKWQRYQIRNLVWAKLDR